MWKRSGSGKTGIFRLDDICRPFVLRACRCAFRIGILWGVVTFGITHFCFIAGIYRIEGIQIGSILGILGIYGVFLMIFHKGLPKLGKLKIPVLLYAAVLSSMVSMAVSAAVIVPGRSRYFLAAGACAFLISDSLIAVRTIEKKQSLLMGAVLLTLYYGAVYMMGMSVYMH